MTESTKTVVLSSPIQGHRGTIREIRFREPKFEDYMALGDPETLVGLSNGGAGFYQDDMQAIRGYIERLAVDVDPNFLALIGLKDTLAIKNTILSFFRDAIRPEIAMEPSGSESQESSSFATDKALGPSTI
jgi:hypothetical protein